jgi:hypothetical protein
VQRAGREVSQEPDLWLDAEARGDEIRDLAHDEDRDEQRPRVPLDQFEALGAVTAVGVDVGVERPDVDQERDSPTSFDRISSMRSEMS